MASSLFGGRGSAPVNNNGNLLQRFAEFKRSMTGKDPEAMVREMLSSGKMSQEEFNRLKSQAQSLMTILR